MSRQGFTLVEVILVVILLSILVSVAIPTFDAIINRVEYKEVGIVFELVRSAAQYYHLKYDIKNLNTADQAAMWATLHIDLPGDPKCYYSISSAGDVRTFRVGTASSTPTNLYTYTLPSGDVNGDGALGIHPDVKYIQDDVPHP